MLNKFGAYQKLEPQATSTERRNIQFCLTIIITNNMTRRNLLTTNKNSQRLTFFPLTKKINSLEATQTSSSAFNRPIFEALNVFHNYFTSYLHKFIFSDTLIGHGRRNRTESELSSRLCRSAALCATSLLPVTSNIVPVIISFGAFVTPTTVLSLLSYSSDKATILSFKIFSILSILT